MDYQNPLERLDDILREKFEKRQSYISILIESVPHITERAEKWFKYEIDTINDEISLLNEILPDETMIWKSRLNNIKKKYIQSIEEIDAIVKKVSYGEIKSMRDVFTGKPESSFNIVEVEIVEDKEKSLNIASSILNLLDSASKLENLDKEIDREIKKILVLRKIIQIEKAK